MMALAQPAPPGPLPEGYWPPREEVAAALAVFDAYPKQAAFQGLIGPEHVEQARQAYRSGDKPYDHELVEYWVSHDNAFIEAMIPAESPHAVAVSYKEGCPLHLGRSDTLVPVWGEPDTYVCAVGGERWAPGMMVKNPGTGEMVRVEDDGRGWFPPKGFPQRGRFCFKSAYRLYLIRKLIDSPYVGEIGFDGPVRPGARNETDIYANAPVYALAWAYAVTGEQRYGDRALLILNRMADTYRWFNSQLDSHVDRRFDPVRSYLHSPNRETWYLQTMAGAYDLAFDALGGAGDVVSYLEQKHGADYDGDGRATTADLKHNIEHNLFGYGWEFLHRAMTHHRPGNMRMSQMRSIMNLSLVFRNDRLLHYALESPRGFRNSLIGSFYREGRNREDSTSYAQVTNGSYLLMAKILERYRGRDLYPEGLDTEHLFAGRLEAIAGWEAIESCDGGRQLNYGDGGEGRKQKLVEPKGPLAQTFLGHEVGLTIMRQGQDWRTRKHVLLYHSNSGRGHGNRDQLMLKIIGYGYDFSADHGYPANLSAPKTTPWTRGTITHPTVLVDAQSQEAAVSASAEFYADAGWAQAAAAWSEQAYPQSRLYHRTAVVVEVDDHRHFVIDVFRVVGGGQHDYAFHSLGGDDAENFAITCDAQLEPRPGTLAGPDVPYASDQTNGYSYIRDIRQGTVSDHFTASWSVGDEAGTGFHLHMLGVPGREVIVGKGEGNGILHRSPLDPYLIVRHTGDGSLSSTFIAVHEPFQGADLGLRIEPLAVPDAAPGQMPAGLKITTGDGKSYHLRTALPIGWESAGRYRGGQSLTLTGPGGTLMIDTPQTRPLRGRIVEVDYATRAMTVLSDSPDADWSGIAGRVIYLDHPGYIKRVAFDVESVAPATGLAGGWVITTRRSGLLATNTIERIDDQGRMWSPFTMEKLLECSELFDGKAMVPADHPAAWKRLESARNVKADGLDMHVLRLSAAPAPPFMAGANYEIHDYAPGDAVRVTGIVVNSDSFE